MGSFSSKFYSQQPPTKKRISESTADQIVNPERKEEDVPKKSPFKSKILAFSQKFSNIHSEDSKSQINLTISQLKLQWGGKRITKIEKYQSPLEMSFWQSISSPSRHILQHWEIIATINDCLYWVISFGQDGLQNDVNPIKNNLISRRKNNKNFQEYTPQRQVTVHAVLDIIEQIKDKKYNIGDWNCQIFTDHIVSKIKSL